MTAQTDNNVANATTKSRKFIPLLLLSCIPFALFMLLFRLVAFQSFSIPSLSSAPNLVPGDFIIVSKLAYRFGDPERGDIAVFKLPSDPATDYVKRIVGMPGDRIQMKDGILFINGEAASQDRVQVQLTLRGAENAEYFREILPNGRSYVIANFTREGSVDNTEEYVVPPGHYFALGDNRDNSQDSRFLDVVGYIPRENFVGRFEFRFWNSEGVPLTGRPEEIYPAP